VLAFDVLGSAVRRRILELLGGGAMSSGEIVEAVQREVDISQPAVSQHLRVLRETGFASVRADGQRRVYEIATTPPIAEIETWLDRLRQGWGRRLDALGTEVARGKRERRLAKQSRRRA
jgi:DNA-binding transcriptional ArsR family regulator